jgi:hypothetical protein
MANCSFASLKLVLGEGAILKVAFITIFLRWWLLPSSQHLHLLPYINYLVYVELLLSVAYIQKVKLEEHLHELMQFYRTFFHILYMNYLLISYLGAWVLMIIHYILQIHFRFPYFHCIIEEYHLEYLSFLVIGWFSSFFYEWWLVFWDIFY